MLLKSKLPILVFVRDIDGLVNICTSTYSSTGVLCTSVALATQNQVSLSISSDNSALTLSFSEPTTLTDTQLPSDKFSLHLDGAFSSYTMTWSLSPSSSAVSNTFTFDVAIANSVTTKDKLVLNILDPSLFTNSRSLPLSSTSL